MGDSDNNPEVESNKQKGEESAQLNSD